MKIKDKVLELHNQGFSINQIEEKTGFTKKQIGAVYSKQKGLLCNRYDLLNIKNDLIQLIVSSLLGDGSFTKPHKEASKLSIAHSVKQKELIEFKLSILKKYNLDGQLCYNKIYNNRYKKGYVEEYRFKSKSHPIFKIIRDLFYINNKKIVSKNFIRLLDYQGLALFYMDDGNVTNHSFQLNVQSFDEKSKNIIRAKLRQFGIKTTIHKQGQIYILSESRDLFINIIKPYILPSMKYKLYPYRVLYKPGEFRGRPEVENPEPS
jgi:hypothetical protein